MQQLDILAGTTSLRAQVFLRDSSASYDKGLTGLLHNTASLTVYYFRDGDTSATAITLVTATVGTWVSGGFKQIDSTHCPGLYELDIPDAALASGAKWVKIFVRGATNLSDEVIHINLVGNNPFAAALSSGANDGIASAILAKTVETGITLQQMLRAIGAAVAGDYTDADGTFDAVGNPGTTRVTTDLSAGDRANTLSV